MDIKAQGEIIHIDRATFLVADFGNMDASIYTQNGVVVLQFASFQECLEAMSVVINGQLSVCSIPAVAGGEGRLIIPQTDKIEDISGQGATITLMLRNWPHPVRINCIDENWMQRHLQYANKCIESANLTA